MKAIEELLLASGISPIAGVDEAGRGPCAGPLVIAAVILKDSTAPELAAVRDSKEISEKKREELFDVIMKMAASVSIIRVIS
jgi:ribonuclease HII